ncbi:MAG: PIN domain-containing protein [Chloroflexota bacterium]
MPEPFLDTNIVLRHVLGDHPDQSPRATAFLQQVENGLLRVHTSDVVVFEVVFTLQRTYRIPKADIRDVVLPLLALSGIVLPGKRRFIRVFELYVEHNIAFADAYHAVLMQQRGLTQIVSFDLEFDRISAITRIGP